MKINKDTKIYGSFSNNPGNNGCVTFNDAFEKYNINAIYKSFYSTDAEKLIISVKHLNFSGFALSMPLKIEIMKYLDEIDIAALEIGAVNTVINKNNKLIGYNTDWLGVTKFFEAEMNKINWNEKKLTILGNGGFSKAIQYACKKLNINYDIIVRENWNKIAELTNVIFNATPVNVQTKGFLIDGRPFTETGKYIASLQAKEQFYLYTGIKYE
jgi:shikimate dehydrogenase